ncbi:MAG: hypothetical protein PHU42_00630 [Patescibacteria group bacterium]|nr:hypothetical protein [Patescibacteria group bacterium]
MTPARQNPTNEVSVMEKEIAQAILYVRDGGSEYYCGAKLSHQDPNEVLLDLGGGEVGAIQGIPKILDKNKMRKHWKRQPGMGHYTGNFSSISDAIKSLRNAGIRIEER